MRVAMISPLVEAVPPALYGGTERVVSALTEALLRRGHSVTLFASGDSRTNAELIPCSLESLRCMGVRDSGPYTERQLALVYGMAGDFDVIHSHAGWPALPYARCASVPTVSTMHGRLDLPHLAERYQRFAEQPLISISIAQQASLRGVNWLT